jgi:hypothetical protein
MGKGVSALSYLPQVYIEFVGSAGDQSINAIRAGFNKIARMQEEEIADGTYSGEVCRTDDPYTSATWDIVTGETTAVAASGTVTCATAIADDTVTVNGLLYTGVAGAKSDNTEFSIDTSDTAAALDLAASITADTRTGTLNDVTAVSALGVVTITQSVVGTLGNATTLVSSDGATLAVSGAVFTGGVDAVDYQLTFDSEVNNVITTIGRPAIATRRIIDLILASSPYPFSVRSGLAMLNFIEKLEDRVAESGTGSTGDATYTGVSLRGSTPFESFDWTITKLGNDYTVTPTITS